MGHNYPNLIILDRKNSARIKPLGEVQYLERNVTVSLSTKIGAGYRSRPAMSEVVGDWEDLVQHDKAENEFYVQHGLGY